MVQNISSIHARIRGIYDRIQEIQKNIYNINSTININPTQKTYNYEIAPFQEKSKPSKTFQEVLNEVLSETRNQDENKINIISKPEESWREIMISNETRENKFDNIIEEASKKYNIPKELIKAVIKAESNFNPIAISPKNAMGLMQLIPSTAKEMGVNNVLDPYENIMGGTKYLRMMLDKFNGNLFLALSAYNAGPDRVIKSNGIPNIEETQEYVDKVIKFYKEYSE
ncbi:MAG: lytic transglycosylase domain-containing protein [Brevinematales bacterium]|nr:lytic transglycosylase domain-containing protein [Brevinematales bacterium]